MTNKPKRSTRGRPASAARSSRSRRAGSPERVAHREQRRGELLDAAVEAIRRHGPAVSMSQIAAAAGVTKPILYRHIGGREEFVAALTERFLTDLNDSIATAVADADAEPRDVLAAGIDAYLILIERETDLYRYLLRHAGEAPGGVEMLARVIRQIGQVTVAVIGERLREAGADSGAAEPWSYGIVGMVHAAGDWWLENRTMPRKRLVEYLVELAWSGMRSAVEDGATHTGQAGTARGTA